MLGRATAWSQHTTASSARLSPWVGECHLQASSPYPGVFKWQGRWCTVPRLYWAWVLLGMWLKVERLFPICEVCEWYSCDIQKILGRGTSVEWKVIIHCCLPLHLTAIRAAGKAFERSVELDSSLGFPLIRQPLSSVPSPTGGVWLKILFTQACDCCPVSKRFPS